MSSLIDYPSPWPLPKFMYAYSSYLYTQDWRSVVLSFYLFKVVYVLIYYLDGGKHTNWFDGLGNLNIHDHGDFNRTIYYEEPSLTSVVVGDFLFLLMGIILGKIQSIIINNKMFYSFVHGFKFKTVDAWKIHFEKIRKLHTKNTIENDKNFLDSYGLWPIQRIFAWRGNDIGGGWWCCCCENIDDDDYLRWAHRRFYWFYFIQVLFMGTPTTLVYTIDLSSDILRMGAVVYYLIQLILLMSFYFWNKYYHLSALKLYNPKSSSITMTTWYTRFNATYLCWFITITFFSIFVIIKISINVSLIIVYAWSFSLVVLFIVYSSFKVVDRFYLPLTKAYTTITTMRHQRYQHI